MYKFLNDSVEEGFKETLFPVDIEPIMNANGEESNFISINNIDANEILSVATKDYMLVPNEYFIQKVWDSMHGIDPVISDIKTFSNTKFYYTINTGLSHEINGEKYDQQVQFFNSYDRTMRCRVSVSLMRLVCTNGMISKRFMSALDFIHKGDTLEIGDITGQIEHTIGNSVAFVNQVVPQLENHQADQLKFLTFVNDVFTEDQVNAVMSMRGNAKVHNAWDELNVLTDFTSHNMDLNVEANFKRREQVIDKFIKPFKLELA